MRIKKGEWLEKIKFVIFPKYCKECNNKFVFEKMKMIKGYGAFDEKRKYPYYDWYCKECNNELVKEKKMPALLTTYI